MKYLLLLAKYSTGQVLHTDGKSLFDSRYEGNSASPYIVVSNLENAEKEAESIVENNPNIEVGLYTEKEEWIKTIRGNYIPPIIVKDKWWKFW
jgi:hypothetical protein